MKKNRFLAISLALVLTTVFLVGCASGSESVSLAENQVVTVQRGNLTIDITAVGNLALSRTEDLAFDIFYQEGSVEEVLVEEGDTVEEGQVLAKLDTSEWEDNLSVLEDQVATEERDLLQAEINLRNAEIALEKAKEAYVWPELEVAEADVEEMEARLQHAIDRNYDSLISTYSALLEAAEKKLNAMLTGADTDEVAIKKLEVELVQGKLEDAQKALVDAQEELDEAKSKSPIIVASFAGFITKVNVEGGDEVFTGTVAVQLADPNKFEADVMVSEMDILQVKLGGDAWVQVDAMQGLSLLAKVTHISPTATIQSGVVNYIVKVEIQSLEAVMQERQQAPLGMIPEDFQLREGLTVTVSILVDERDDVLLIPNSAITRRGAETYVQVMKYGVPEERLIKTGISDYQNTEVIEGLSEGEKVIVPQGTTKSTTPTSRSPMPFLRR